MVKKKPTGRVCVKGKQRISLSFEQSAYKIELKLAVLAYWKLAYWKSNDMETSIAQTADVSWNKPSKVKMREYWTNKIVLHMKNMSTFRASAPSSQELLGWILNVWGYLSEDTIKS